MSKPSITFVLGAGASAEVNMPIGSKLMNDIQTLVDLKVDPTGVLYGPNLDFIRSIQHLAADLKSVPNQLYKSSRHIFSGLHQAPSIDNFIDCQKEDDLVAHIGKLAITTSILAAEKNSDLYKRMNAEHLSTNIIDLGQESIKNSWYNSFFILLTERKSKQSVIERFRSVKVISFNYDRTLEHFMHSALQNFYKISSTEAADILDSLEIYHPYGTVGDLPWTDSINVSDYGEALSPQKTLALSRKIRTFTEGSDLNKDQTIKIHEAVISAKKVIFLGFAFHPINLDLLYPQRPKIINYEQTIYGSAYMMSEENTYAIAEELSLKTGLQPGAIRLRNDLKAAGIFNSFSRLFQV